MSTTSAHTEDWLNYQQAATELHRSLSSVQRAASEGILHPISRRGTNMKFIHRDEIEWFKDKTLSHINAILYQDTKRPQEPYPSFKQVGDAFSEFLESPEFEQILLTLLPVMQVYVMKHADAEQMDYLREGMREDMRKLAQNARHDEKSRNFLNGLAHRLTETLTRKDLSFVERKVYRELLDAALETVSAESGETATA